MRHLQTHLGLEDRLVEANRDDVCGSQNDAYVSGLDRADAGGAGAHVDLAKDDRRSRLQTSRHRRLVRHLSRDLGALGRLMELVTHATDAKDLKQSIGEDAPTDIEERRGVPVSQLHLAAQTEDNPRWRKSAVATRCTVSGSWSTSQRVTGPQSPV